MKTMKLMAVKPHRYGTRHLTAGEEYEAPIRQAVAMVAARKARFTNKSKPVAKRAIAAQVPTEAPLEATPQPVEPQHEPADIDQLRLQATQLGINVDGRWGAHRLQQEIQARQPPIGVEGRR